MEPKEKYEIAKLLSECRHKAAVEAICILYDIRRPVIEPTSEADSVMDWVSQTGVPLENGCTKELYEEYAEWCTNYGFSPAAHAVFSRAITRNTVYVIKKKRHNGEVISFFVSPKGATT